MKKSILFLTAFCLNTSFGQIVTTKLCDEKNLSPVKGPIPYGPRIINPPDHDLPGDPVPLPVHKGVTLDIWHNPVDSLQVGGLALLANGSMLELDYNGKLYHVTGLDSAQKVKRRLISDTFFPEALGLFVRNNREVYINSANSIWKYDFDGTDLTQEQELLKIPKRGGWYGWNSDIEADDTSLYFGTSSRGSISQYNLKTKTWIMDYGMAMRNTHGMGKDASGKIWFSDNQGNYRPATPIFLLKQGKNYGVPTVNWTSGAAAWQSTFGPDADLEAYKTDMLWIPYNEMSHSATDIHFMKSGPFKGQALVGDNRTGHLNRLIPESVNGQMQGAVIRMTGGLEAGNYRIVEDAKGNFYLGGLGTPRNTYWVWCQKPYGFQKLTFKPGFVGSTTYNDVHTVSLVKDGIVVTFTSDISTDFLNAANYRAYTFNYLKSVSQNYGGPKVDSVGAKIQSIVKRSNREIMISVNGLLKESLLALEFGSQLTVNNNLQSSEMYYTMNQLSTRVPTDLFPVGEKWSASAIQITLNGDFLYVVGFGKQASEYEILDLSGKICSQVSFHEWANSGKVNISPLKKGVYLLSLKVGSQRLAKTFLVP